MSRGVGRGEAGKETLMPTSKSTGYDECVRLVNTGTDAFEHHKINLAAEGLGKALDIAFNDDLPIHVTAQIGILYMMTLAAAKNQKFSN